MSEETNVVEATEEPIEEVEGDKETEGPEAED